MSSGGMADRSTVPGAMGAVTNWPSQAKSGISTRKDTIEPAMMMAA